MSKLKFASILFVMLVSSTASAGMILEIAGKLESITGNAYLIRTDRALIVIDKKHVPEHEQRSLSKLDIPVVVHVPAEAIRGYKK